MTQLTEFQRTTPALPGQIMPGMAGYRMCVSCVMDTTHVEADFDEAGLCNYCRGFEQTIGSKRVPYSQLQAQLDRQIEEIKRSGRGKDYDCILGVSGGVDSSYLALKCKDWELRPLLVQFDNGWNTELANHNIQRLCEELRFDLHTHVVDWSEFRELQLSFLRAGVANFEAPSDHGIFACIYNTSVEKNIEWLLSGVNFATEASVPLAKKGVHVTSYGYNYQDLVHIKAIHRRFGNGPLTTYPQLGFFRRTWLERSGGVRRLDPLNYMQYVKEDAIRELQDRVGWRRYQGKHFESVITRFHQCYLLPIKFGLDKRKLHLSGLIWSGQLTREAALDELREPPCPPAMLAQDYDFFVKKMRLSVDEFESIMAAPVHTYRDYPNIQWLYKLYSNLMTAASRVKRRLRFW